MRATVVLVLALAIPSCLAFREVVRNDKLVSEFEQSVENVLRKEYARNWRKQGYQGASNQLLGFSWETCNTTVADVGVEALSLTGPLAFPGRVTLSTVFNIRSDFGQPLKADVKLKKKVFGFFVEIPCVDNIGSCTYDDLCEMLAPLAAQCPDQLTKIGIHCSCPFKADSYQLKDVTFELPSLEVVLGGDYEAEAHLTMNSIEVACITVKFSIK